MTVPTRRRAATAATATVAVAAALVSFSGCRLRKPAPAPGTATVEAVIDGDTVVLRIGDRTEHARLIGINTPETVDRNKPVECHGPEASTLTKHLLPPNTAVRVERDIEARDTYNRLLVYLYRAGDNLFVNREIAARGEAYELRIEPNTAHADEIAASVTEARRSGLGLWSACPIP